MYRKFCWSCLYKTVLHYNHRFVLFLASKVVLNITWVCKVIMFYHLLVWCRWDKAEICKLCWHSYLLSKTFLFLFYRQVVKMIKDLMVQMINWSSKNKVLCMWNIFILHPCVSFLVDLMAKKVWNLYKNYLLKCWLKYRCRTSYIQKIITFLKVIHVILALIVIKDKPNKNSRML